MTLKNKIIKDINKILFCKDLNEGKISIFSMKMFYHLTYEILVKEDIDKEDKSYNIAGLCADNIECMINNLFVMQQLKLLTDEEIYIMIHNIILTNIKYY